MKYNLFYKYRTFGEFTDSIILNSEFYFSTPLAFNDPFDCNLSYREKYSNVERIKSFERYEKEDLRFISVKKLWNDNDTFLKIQEDTKNKLLEEMGVFSMSKSYTDILMWSHYSQEHKGLVFELDKNKDQEFFVHCMEVIYTKNYNEFSYIVDERIETTRFLLTKSIHWKYENEYRIIKFSGNGFQKFNKNMITSILFGCRAEDFQIKKIIQLCQLNGFTHVIFKKAKIVPGKFELDFYEIDKEDYL